MHEICVKSRQLLAEICLLFRFDDDLEEFPGAIVDVIEVLKPHRSAVGSSARRGAGGGKPPQVGWGLKPHPTLPSKARLLAWSALRSQSFRLYLR